MGSIMALTRINEPLKPPLAHGGEFMDPDGQVVGRLGRVLAVEVPGRDDGATVAEDQLQKVVG